MPLLGSPWLVWVTVTLFTPCCLRDSVTPVHNVIHVIQQNTSVFSFSQAPVPSCDKRARQQAQQGASEIQETPSIGTQAETPSGGVAVTPSARRGAEPPGQTGWLEG